MALASRNLFSECLTVTQSYLNSRSCDQRMVSIAIQYKSSLTNMNIILSSTTAAPATPLSTTRQAVQFEAPTKGQRVTEAKGVALLCYV